MKKFLQTLFVASCSLLVYGAYADTQYGLTPTISGGGGNLTSFSNQQGAINNEQYNLMMNPARQGATPAVAADFGNCNALILRCATPKCGSGGCVDIAIATPIVAGCVASSNECKKHGDPLIQSIAAQMVASSTAKANAAANNASQAQSAQQLEQMTAQMQALQQQMAQSQAASQKQLQSALEQQQQQLQTALQQQQAAAVQTSAPVSTQSGAEVSADLIARQQVIGQVMDSLDGVDTQLKTLKKTVQNVLDYGKCDYNGNSCSGPRRIKTFRTKAQGFFEPYDGVLDSLEDSLYTAMSAGIDVSEIYMMLNNTCQQWGKYLCQYSDATPFVYCKGGNYDATRKEKTATTPISEGLNTANCKTYEWSDTGDPKTNTVKKIPNPNCTFVEMYRNDQRDQIQQNYIVANSDDATNIRMACISDGVLNSGIFARRSRKQSSIDLDTLELIINQDEPRGSTDAKTANIYCNTLDKNKLEQAIKTKKYDSLLAKMDGTNLVTTGCTSLDIEGCDYANPMYAMCSTHVYNIGATNNNLSAADKSNMTAVIGLKTTFMAQQLKKQYDYLSSVVKQMKNQLQKSIMTVSSSSNGGSGSSSSTQDLAGIQDCAARAPQSTLECLRNNYQVVSRNLSSTNMVSTALKNQVDRDWGILKATLKGLDKDTLDGNISCEKGQLTNVKAVKDCLELHMNSGFIAIQRALDTPLSSTTLR